MIEFTNKDRVEEYAKKLGLQLSCYSRIINELSEKQLEKVIVTIEDQFDTEVSVNRKKYVIQVQINEEKQEVNLVAITKKEYVSRYGDLIY